MFCIAVLVSVVSPTLSPAETLAQTPSQAELLERLQRLEKNQAELYELLKSKDARLDELESELRRAKQAQEAPPAPAEPAAPVVDAKTQAPAAPAPPAPATKYFGRYVPGKGFVLAQTDMGDVTFSAYTYVRYLNQKGLDDTFTNGLGNEVRIDKRDDVELNKAVLYLKGWFVDPRFRYLLYTWTNNTNQGQGAQVVVAGNLTYAFNDAIVVGGGVASLPTARSTAGNFPLWLTVDHRTIADEFFRGSYTMGFFASGALTRGLEYDVMLGNNLSQLGVDAGQMDGDFTTVSGQLVWMPTTGEFGPRSAFGDYEAHENLATRLAAHFSFSPEDKQSQPNTDDPDNSQIRLSNGTIIFTPGALAPGVSVKDVKYYMADFDAGLKYRGFALEAEYYWRWLNDFNADGPLPVHDFFDHGFQVQGSAMVVPKILQVYTQGSYIFGERGDPWEVTGGLNWYVFKRRGLRVNLEYMYDRKSPVGYFAIPEVVGGTGSIVHTNVELNF